MNLKMGLKNEVRNNLHLAGLVSAIILVPACAAKSGSVDARTALSRYSVSTELGQSAAVAPLLREIADSAPDSSCPKPGEKDVQNIEGDELGQVWITTGKANGQISSIPENLLYMDAYLNESERLASPPYHSPYTIPETGTEDKSWHVSQIYVLTCTEESSRENEKQAVFKCDNPVEQGSGKPAKFSVEGGSLEMGTNVHQISFRSGLSCDRKISYETQFTWFKGATEVELAIKEANSLNGKTFPTFFSK
jgi:hypothetical protein